MPVLKITNSSDDPFDLAMNGGCILATMLYPADGETREHVTELWGAVLNQYPGPGQAASHTA